MNINTTIPVFRFATTRNPKPTPPTETYVDITRNSGQLVDDLSALNTGYTNEEAIDEANTILQDYINGTDFIKTKEAFFTAIDIGDPKLADINLMFDNLIVRLLTKSNTNEVYGLLVKYIREFGAALNSTTSDLVRIIIPDKITFAFTEFEGTNTAPSVDTTADELLENMNKMLSVKKKITEARNNNIVAFETGGKVRVRNFKFQALHQALGSSQITVADAETLLDDKLSDINTRATTDRAFPQTEEVFSGTKSLSGVDTSNVGKLLNEGEYYQQLRNMLQPAIDASLTTLQELESVSNSYYNSVLTDLSLTSNTAIDAAEVAVNEQIDLLFKNLDIILPGRSFALVSGSWQEVTQIVNGEVIEDSQGTSVMIYSHGCYLKYPVQVADLRIIEQQTVGYVPAEIAHINNTQRGEKNTRVTRRLKKVETSETLISESEMLRETDTQSAERFSIENDASQVQQEENSWNVNASASYQTGPFSASVSGGYNNSSLEVNSNSTAQTYAKDIMTRIVDRVSNRTRVERSLKTVEEFEETVTHEIDNEDQETKSYIYRWLNKLVRGTLRNYGKRLIFQVDIAHPAHFYLSRMIKEKPQLNIPADPRDFTIAGVPFSPDMIVPQNYLSWGKLYHTKLDAPPEQNTIISETFNGTSGVVIVGKLLAIPKGYQCKRALVTNTYYNGWPGGNQLRILIGNSSYAHYTGTDDFWTPRVFWLNNERGNLPVSIMQSNQGFAMNVEVHCELTPEALTEWQTKCYYDLLEGYDRMKSEAETKINSFDINAPGLSPGKKMELIRNEIKKEAIRKLFRCNPFWVNDNYQVGKEYNPDCCKDSYNTERVRFIETVFDWKNLSYEFYPYFYSNKNVWNKVLDLTDDDPHFEAFMQSSFATVRIPVHRDNLKEIAACNFLVNNAIGNYDTIPEGLADLLEELASQPVSIFDTDLEGESLDSETVELGVFPVPTSLVILECSNQDGVKPIGFPQVEAEISTLEIPKQYSPAIIADNCIPPTP